MPEMFPHVFDGDDSSPDPRFDAKVKRNSEPCASNPITLSFPIPPITTLSRPSRHSKYPTTHNQTRGRHFLYLSRRLESSSAGKSFSKIGDVYSSPSAWRRAASHSSGIGDHAVVSKSATHFAARHATRSAARFTTRLPDCPTTYITTRNIAPARAANTFAPYSASCSREEEKEWTE